MNSAKRLENEFQYRPSCHLGQEFKLNGPCVVSSKHDDVLPWASLSGLSRQKSSRTISLSCRPRASAVLVLGLPPTILTRQRSMRPSNDFFISNDPNGLNLCTKNRLFLSKNRQCLQCSTCVNRSQEISDDLPIISARARCEKTVTVESPHRVDCISGLIALCENWHWIPPCPLPTAGQNFWLSISYTWVWIQSRRRSLLLDQVKRFGSLIHLIAGREGCRIDMTHGN